LGAFLFGFLGSRLPCQHWDGQRNLRLADCPNPLFQAQRDQFIAWLQPLGKEVGMGFHRVGDALLHCHAWAVLNA
jgi:hypothetical protein